MQENELTSITGGGNLSDLQDLHVRIFILSGGHGAKDTVQRSNTCDSRIEMVFPHQYQASIIDQSNQPTQPKTYSSDMCTFPFKTSKMSKPMSVQLRISWSILLIFLNKHKMDVDSLCSLAVCLSALRRQRTVKERISGTIELFSGLMRQNDR